MGAAGVENQKPGVKDAFFDSETETDSGNGLWVAQNSQEGFFYRGVAASRGRYGEVHDHIAVARLRQEEEKVTTPTEEPRQPTMPYDLPSRVSTLEEEVKLMKQQMEEVKGYLTSLTPFATFTEENHT